MIALSHHVRTIAAAAGMAAAVALTACTSESPEETASSAPAETSTPADATSTPAEEDPTSEGVGDLEGTWNLDAAPPEASTLTIDASGYAKYTTEGTIVDYWEGTAVPSSDSTFTIEFTPSEDSQDETGAEDYEFTAEVTVQADGDTLAWTSDGYDSTYIRAE
ncbi:hypothetical protein [Glycomyces harbinensis]|nr:hypothetical protein [Glycomyces harbinensis]